MSTRFEQLPNESLLDLFEYVDTGDLFQGFWGLNLRLNKLLRSVYNRSFIMKTNNFESIGLLPKQIVQLIVNHFDEIDYSQFPNLCSLKLSQPNRSQLKQIQPESLPHLAYFSSAITDDSSSSEIAGKIFCNQFPSLCYVRLGEVNVPYSRLWSSSPCIQSVGIHSYDPAIIFHVLAACPNLNYLHIIIQGGNCRTVYPPPSVYDHPLKRFRLEDLRYSMSVEDINNILICIPQIEWINLQFNCEIPFIQFAQNLSNRLLYLKEFRCQIKEKSNDNSSNNIELIQNIHPSFHRLQFIRRRNGYRLFTTTY